MEPQDYDDFYPEWGEWWKRADELLNQIGFWAEGARFESKLNELAEELREHINGMPPCPSEETDE